MRGKQHRKYKTKTVTVTLHKSLLIPHLSYCTKAWNNTE